MMFITVTRHGGGRPLRLAVGAIAWLDEADAGAVIRLTSGDGLHVAETVAEIEAAIPATAAHVSRQRGRG